MKICFVIDDLKQNKYSKSNSFKELLLNLSNKYSYSNKSSEKAVLKNEEFLINLYSSKIRSKTILNEFPDAKVSIDTRIKPFFVKKFLHNFLNVPQFIKKDNLIYITKLPFQKIFHKNKIILELSNLIPYTYPDFFKFNYNELEVLDCLNRVDYLIVHSNEMKNDLIKKMFFKENKITVIPRAVPDNFSLKSIDPKKLDEIKKKYALKNFILFSGKITRYKNLERLISAFLELKLKDTDLLIAGSFDTEYESYDHAFSYYKLILNLSKISNNIKMLSYVNREEMPYLIKSSIAVVEPSYFNNFPDTILEAQAMGTPVIASNILSHSNFIKNEKLLFSPYSIEEMKNSIKNVLNEKHSTKDTVSDYRWDNVLDKYKDFFKSVSV